MRELEGERERIPSKYEAVCRRQFTAKNMKKAILLAIKLSGEGCYSIVMTKKSLIISEKNLELICKWSRKYLASV